MKTCATTSMTVVVKSSTLWLSMTTAAAEPARLRWLVQGHSWPGSVTAGDGQTSSTEAKERRAIQPF
jgi:hypothetical protein